MRFLLSATLVLLLSAFVPAPRVLVVETGTPHTLSVSGLAGNTVTTRMPGNDAILWGLHLDEKGDVPCDLELFWWRQNTRSDLTQGLFKTRFRTCGDATSSNGWAAIGHTESMIWLDSDGVPTGDPHEVDGAPDTFLAAHGLRACLNRRGDRIKGVRLFGSTVNQDGEGEARRDPALQSEFERTNCNEWKPMRRCPVGEVMVGVDIHTTGDEIHGLAPKCASVEVREVMVARPN